MTDTTSKKLKILILEDRPTDAELAKRLLRRAGMSFVSKRVETRDTFLAQLDKWYPDLILADYQLPQFDGIAALKVARERAPKVPVVMFTGSINEETAVECLKAGAVDYVLKDRPAGLAPAVQRALERKQDRERREQAERSLRESEVRYRMLVDSSQGLICVHSLDGTLLSVNPATARSLGYEASEIVGRNFVEFLAPDVQSGFSVYLAGVKQEGVHEGELRVVTRTGEERVWAYRNVLCERTGQEPYVLGHALDITERKTLELQLRQAQKMEAIGELTGGIAHDFNNLLSVIRSNAELLAMELDDGELRSYAVDIENAAGNGGRLIRDLMGFSRQADLVVGPIDLRETVNNTVKMVRRIISETITVEVEIAAGGELVRADARAVQQILLNLCTNARDAMPDGGRIVIELKLAVFDEAYKVGKPYVEPGEYVCVEVRDTGMGMDDSVREKIFEPFFSTKPEGRGTGLGLSMVYGLMKQHGGYINVYSEVGEGTRISLYFPHLKDAVTSRPSGKTRAGPPLTGTATVLVVEDHDAVRAVACRALAKLGYRVIESSDGMGALGIMKSRGAEIDVVFSDLVMPRLGGLELFEELRKIGGQVPFLLASGYGSKELAERSDLMEQVVFIQKPWTLTELGSAVREAIEGGAQR